MLCPHAGATIAAEEQRSKYPVILHYPLSSPSLSAHFNFAKQNLIQSGEVIKPKLVMAERTSRPAFDKSKPVLIIGAGVVGLTLAQGCRQAGIPFQIFESHDASSEKSQCWGLTLHWSLNSLERTIGLELTALLQEVRCC
jgi:hypothetical protein